MTGGGRPVGTDTGVVVHAAHTVLPLPGPPVTGGAVAVAAGRIVAVGRREDLVRQHPAARVRDWPGLLTPGLVNAHVHLQYSDFADLADPERPFPDWLRGMALRRREMDDAGWRDSARRGAEQALRTGTTAVADVVSDPAVLDCDLGLDGVRYVEVVAVDSARWAASGRDRLLAALDGCEGVAAAGAPAVGVSPHSLYTLAPDVFADCVAVARGRGLRLHPHLAETADEDEFVRTGTGAFSRFAAAFGLDVAGGPAGRSPAEQLDALGGLGGDVHVAHGVHLDPADRALLARRGTAVAVCVRSNRTLGAGVAPVTAMLYEGLTVAVGTDSLASVGSLDLLDELAALRAVAVDQGLEPDIADRLLVAAVTTGGAAAIGRPDLGALRPGVPADFAVFDIDAGADPYRALTTGGGGRCLATVRLGRVVHDRVPA